MRVSDTTTTSVASRPPIFTVAPLTKAVPSIVTIVPPCVVPNSGNTELIVGGTVGWNVAGTARAAVIANVHVLVPEQAPDQPVNFDPASAVAVRTTEVPMASCCKQSTPQLIPAGLLTTLPDPDPALVMDKGKTW